MTGVNVARAGRTLWGFVRVYAPAALLTLGGFLLAYQFVDPAPPDTVVIATGGEDGAYYRFANRYREIFAREGIALEVRSTNGSVENLALLSDEDNDVDLAFVQGGVANASSVAPGAGETEEELLALGSVYFEPLWFFHTLEDEATQIRALASKRIAIGPKGSGTRAVAEKLLERNDVVAGNAELLPLGGVEAARALIAGELDGVFLVASPAAKAVRDLLAHPEVSTLSFGRAEAYTRIYPFLSKVTLPRGAVDLAGDIPSSDISLLAPSANLVATSRLHPAVIDLLLQAATQVHGRGGIFENYGQFPSPEYIDYRLSDEAQRFYKSGPPFLQRFMPFWAATLVDRLLVMLLPVVALLIPLMRLMPPLYRWRMRARVYRWYKELLATDPTTVEGPMDQDVGQRLAELERIEDEVSRVHVPMSFADQLYHLRMHIELVREKLIEGSRTTLGTTARPSSEKAEGSAGD